ncbi:MAG: crotonase/enoyl-CoA hydratase family protein [Deltaproteobacteria bacterium]|nr:crotonase/enoyl-CoA hydratase family protein [Deltaproteobacteria bacterium]
MENCFKIEKEGHVAWLILNRPDKRNTMTWEFFAELVSQGRALDADPEVRAVILRAEGKMFTAGLDLVAASSLLGDGSAPYREGLRRKVFEFQEAMSAPEKCRKPVIAAVHGHCIGGGVDLISACDIRLATKDAVFSVRETRLGIVADGGTLQRLPRLIGHGRAAELALTGRDFTAEEALSMGFVTRLCEDREALLAEAKRLADEIANLPPLTVQGVKDTLVQARDNGVYPGLEYVAQKNAALIPNQDMLEAVAAFLEKRRPVFKGR